MSQKKTQQRVEDAPLIVTENGKEKMNTNEEIDTSESEHEDSGDTKANVDNNTRNKKKDTRKKKRSHSQKNVEATSSSHRGYKTSLAHYFSTIVVTFITLIFAGTAVLFIWSNQSDGAKVRLTVNPIFNSVSQSNTSNCANTATALLVSFFNKNNYDFNIAPSCNEMEMDNVGALLMLMDRYPSLEVEKHLGLSTNMKGKIPSDVNLEYDEIIFKFSLVSSIQDFWFSKAYSLAILICGFSGIWPYVKLILLTLCWLQPLSFHTRENILTFLDQLGKFSFIDVFVTVFMVVSFYVDLIKSTETIGLQVKVQVEPDIGLMTFTLGTILSQIYSHVLLYWDQAYGRPQYFKWLRKRQTLQLQQGDQQTASKQDVGQEIPEEEEDEEEEEEEGEEIGPNSIPPKGLNSPLLAEKAVEIETSDHNINKWFDRSFVRESRFFTKKHPWNSQYMPFALRFVPKTIFGIALRSIFLAAMVFNVWALYNSIICAPVRYDIEGLTGWALGDASHRAYTTWEVLTKLSECTDYKTNAYLLGIVYFITVMLMPMCTIVICALLWWLPTNYYSHFILSQCLLPCMAWSAIDVFTVSCMAAAAELSRVSEWIINQNFPESCGPEGFIVKLTHQECFSVQGKITWGCYVVGGASVCLWQVISYTVIQRNKAQREIEKLVPEKDRPIAWKI